MNYNRRRVTLGLAAASVFPATALSQAPLKLSLAHNSAPASPKGMGAAKFAELVAAKSNGRISVHVAPSEQLGNENTNMGALRTGTLDLGSLGQGAMLSVAPEVAALGLPFLFTSLPEAWAMLDGPVGRIWRSGSRLKTSCSWDGGATASGRPLTTSGRSTRRVI